MSVFVCAAEAIGLEDGWIVWEAAPPVGEEGDMERYARPSPCSKYIYWCTSLDGPLLRVGPVEARPVSEGPSIQVPEMVCFAALLTGGKEVLKPEFKIGGVMQDDAGDQYAECWVSLPPKEVTSKKMPYVLVLPREVVQAPLGSHSIYKEGTTSHKATPAELLAHGFHLFPIQSINHTDEELSGPEYHRMKEVYLCACATPPSPHSLPPHFPFPLLRHLACLSLSCWVLTCRLGSRLSMF